MGYASSGAVSSRPGQHVPASTSLRLDDRFQVPKSFKPRGGPRTPPDDPKNPTVDFHGQARRNDTRQSTTDPDARSYKKATGREAKLAYLGHPGLTPEMVRRVWVCKQG